jgi:hypothetical protein
MVTGNEVAKVGTYLARPPDKVISEAFIAVDVFKKVIERKPHKVIINDEQYLEYEDWQTLGEFYRCSAITHDAVPVEINGVKGAKARADLVNIDTGLIIGGAEAYCLRDEERWSTRPKYEWQGEGKSRKRIKIGDEAVPWFQLASMAQTRAGSKAFSNRLRWVAVMAGYRGTPAEEMTDNTVSESVQERRTVDKSSHYCAVHDVNFFKKGRMKGYAHPIEDAEGKDTGEWCNEHTDKPDKPPYESSEDANSYSEQQKTEPKKQQEESTQPELKIDMVWLKESLDKLNWTGVGKWMSDNYKISLGKKVSDMVKQLTIEQQENFVKEVENRLQMI